VADGRGVRVGVEVRDGVAVGVGVLVGVLLAKGVRLGRGVQVGQCVSVGEGDTGACVRKALVGVADGVTDAAMACDAGVTAGRADCGMFIIKMITPMPSTQMSAIANTASTTICFGDMLYLPDMLRASHA
jgi:hypothetical protein